MGSNRSNRLRGDLDVQLGIRKCSELPTRPWSCGPAVVIVLALVIGVGCKREKLQELDAQGQREAKECGEPGNPPPPPPPGFAGSGVHIDYDRSVPRPDHTKGVDTDYMNKLVRDPGLLEQVYHDASLGHARASWLTCHWEVVARNSGRNLARYLASLRCQTVAGCTVRFGKLPLSQKTASGSRLLGYVVSEYESEARKHQLRQELIVHGLGLLGIKAAMRIKPAPVRSIRSNRPAGRGPRGCFAAGTVVHGARGKVAIETVEPGDRILTRDPITGKISSRRVSETFVVAGLDQMALTLEHADGTTELLRTTAEHPFWAVRHGRTGWTQAGDLDSGDGLLARDGSPVRVLARRRHLADEPVYNLAVEDHHTFLVGDAGVWVHNKPMRNPGPGSWQTVKEGMSARAATYQEQITGTSVNNVYVVRGVRFDGFKNGTLLDAKGPGYAKFVHNGTFEEWFRGKEGLLTQAKNQVRVAEGTPVVWHVAEREIVPLFRKLLRAEGVRGIEVVHTAVKP